MNNTQSQKPVYRVTPFPILPADHLTADKQEKPIVLPLKDSKEGIWLSKEKVLKLRSVIHEAKQLKKQYARLRSAYQQLDTAYKKKDSSSLKKEEIQRLKEIVAALERYKWAKHSAVPQLLKEMGSILDK